MSLRRNLFFSLSILSLLFISNARAQDPAPSRAVFGFDESLEPVIDSMIASMSLEEKVFMVHGDGMFASGGIERLGIPNILYTDGPTGVREELGYRSWEPLGLDNDAATFFPTGTALGATWNKELAYRYGLALGNETRARGKDIILGPGVNIIRTPLCGRNFEYFSEDPLLSSAMTVGYVKGVQMQDVAACVKHYIANNQEYQRGFINVEMSERTLREIYLPAYKAAALEAEAYSFMGSYNKFRGDWVCENDYLLNTILRDEWNYKGAVVSDWGATHTTTKAALNGLDVEMGGGWGRRTHHFASLADTVRAGKVPESVLDDKVRRLLRISLNCKTTSPDRNAGGMNNHLNSQLAYDVASEAIVLLKNENQALPLDKDEIENLAIIGMMSDITTARGGYTAGVKPKYEITPLQGIKEYLGDKVKISYAPGYAEKLNEVKLANGRTRRFPDAEPNKSLIKEAVKLAKKVDHVLLFVGNPRSVETEATDRKNITLPFGQDELIKAVTAANPNTTIVVVSGSSCDLNTASEHTPALVYSWYNGSENGKALAHMLFGEVNPSGKLPFTIPVKLEDFGAHSYGAESYPGVDGRVEYKEGFLVGYRWFDTRNIAPAYCFGYGLSYTNFNTSSVKTDQQTYPVDGTIRLSVKVSNEGDRNGMETVQVYVRKADSKVTRANKELKGFAKINVEAGKMAVAEIEIPVKDLAYFNAEQMEWVTEKGKYSLLIGNSSGNITEEVDILIR